MAGISKRSLYQPAAAGKAKNSRRKPLAQGILADSGTFSNDESSRSYSEVQSHVEKEEKKKITSTLQAKFAVHDSPDRFMKTTEDPNATDQFKTPEKEERVSAYKNQVLVVDASGPAFGSDTTEISTVSHKVFSPAKVICHSPSPDRESHKVLSSNADETLTVKVDSPTKIIFEDRTILTDEASNEADHDSTDKSSRIDSKQQEKPVKKKKKAPRIVQSRYKNPKESKPPRVAKEATTSAKMGEPSFINDISAIASHSIVEGQSKGQDAKKKKAKVTSTPFDPAAWSERTRFIADGSYLDLSRHMGHETRTQTTIKDERKRTGKTTSADSGIAFGTQEQQETVTTTQLDHEYCRMLQAMYLHAKAKESFTKQEKEAKDQIYNMWQENQRLKSEIRQLEQATLAKKQTMALDQMLKIQDAGLRPLDESLGRLHNNYSTMGEALDNTRHFVQVDDVVLKEPEKLVAALKENQVLLAEISSSTGRKQLDIEKMATNLSQMVETLAVEMSSLDRCEDLLVAANTLTTHERSLQSQILEADGI